MKLKKISPLFAVITLVVLLFSCSSTDKNPIKSSSEKAINQSDSSSNKEISAKISVSNGITKIANTDIGIKLSNSKYANEESFEDPEWISFQDSVLIIDYEWETIQSIGSIGINLGNDFRSKIYPPKKITLKLSQDGSTYKNGSVITRFDQTQKISKTTMNFGPNNVKKLRLVIESYGQIKNGLPGEGEKALLYLDDVIIN